MTKDDNNIPAEELPPERQCPPGNAGTVAQRLADMSPGVRLTVGETSTLRKRVEYEDQLLNSRTGVVLTLNGLMAIASSMPLPNGAKGVAAGFIIIINFLWVVCSLDAARYIHGLSAYINEGGNVPIDEAVRKLRQTGFRVGSTRFMAVWIPFLLLFGWILGAAESMWGVLGKILSCVGLC